jgi:two-component system sensor histidine kinase KdpD
MSGSIVEELLMNKTKINLSVNYLFIMTGLLISATATGYLFRAIEFPETNIVLVYLLAVLLTARMTQGYIYSILASIIATAAFNYFFAEPYLAFSVDASNYIVTFIIMTITALITSTLASHDKKKTLESQKKEAETKALYTLTNRLTGAADMNEIADIAVSTINDIMSTQAAIFCFDEKEMSDKTPINQVQAEREIQGSSTDKSQSVYFEDDEYYNWPIYGREMKLGIIRIPKDRAETMNESQNRLLQTMIESIALAMDHYWSMKERIRSNEEAMQERYRGNMLRAIAHDLRTPLSGIIGTSEMLMDMTESDDARYNLAKGIYKEANWLHSLVENILSLTRLQDGRLALSKQTEAVEEVVGSAVSHIQRNWPEREITVSVPDELLLVPMDAKLIEQVLINLLENAVKHTLPDQEISITVKEDMGDNYIVFTVADRGKGIDPVDLPNIFQMFYTSSLKHSDSQYGIGLGLSICDAIIKAHGGSIEAHNRTDGQGAVFIFKLPMEVNENELL